MEFDAAKITETIKAIRLEGFNDAYNAAFNLANDMQWEYGMAHAPELAGAMSMFKGRLQELMQKLKEMP